jgi:hypothetical protein
VIIADPRRDKTPALLHAMGRIIEGLGGRYMRALIAIHDATLGPAFGGCRLCGDLADLRPVAICQKRPGVTPNEKFYVCGDRGAIACRTGACAISRPSGTTDLESVGTLAAHLTSPITAVRSISE